MARYGLYRFGDLVGVAVFSVPVHDAVLRPFTRAEGTELGRFVLLDEVPGNGETWFLARCFDHLRAMGLIRVVSMSDDTPRTDIAGRTVFSGHLGGIYQAANAVYTGRSSKKTDRLLPDGSVFSPRAASKIRKLDRGWRYSAEQLYAAGAGPIDMDDLAGWLRARLSRVTRTQKHPGNHRYVWAINRRHVRRLPKTQKYLKMVAA